MKRAAALGAAGWLAAAWLAAAEMTRPVSPAARAAIGGAGIAALFAAACLIPKE